MAARPAALAPSDVAKAADPPNVRNTPERIALADFCHALFNANEFCHIE
jgi:hypothetical protein